MGAPRVHGAHGAVDPDWNISSTPKGFPPASIPGIPGKERHAGTIRSGFAGHVDE